MGTLAIEGTIELHVEFFGRGQLGEENVSSDERKMGFCALFDVYEGRLLTVIT